MKQEAEESKIQLAQQFITLSNAIQQVAGLFFLKLSFDMNSLLEVLILT